MGKLFNQPRSDHLQNRGISFKGIMRDQLRSYIVMHFINVKQYFNEKKNATAHCKKGKNFNTKYYLILY